MELIQNSVKKREGKKWKQRWVVLRKDSLKTCQEDYYYLFFYKDAAHAKDGKEKNTIPLRDFCGFDFCTHYDKEENILILITSSQTVYLAFDYLPVRDHWKQTFIEHFGEAVTFRICIPDKQRLKPGDATIRLYSSFVSIITSNTYKCLSRWYMYDIQSYSSVDNAHFMFEIASSLKTKGGNVINLLVNNNADDISKAFDNIASETRNNKPCTLQRHSSAILDELDQAKRNVGDQNFFRRTILRASERMRKKKRKPAATSSAKKRPCNNSAQQQQKFCSLDRKKDPQISIDLDADSLRKTIQLMSQSSSVDNIDRQDGEADQPVSDLPRKGSAQYSDNHSLIIEPEASSSHDDSKPSLDSAFADSTASENDVPSTPVDENKEEMSVSESDSIFYESDSKEQILHGMNATAMESDKSDLSIRNTRRSVDSFMSYKHPARYAIAKTKGSTSKQKLEKTPTPPPRSPVSLGLAPCVFQFPPADELENSATAGEGASQTEPSVESSIPESSNVTSNDEKLMEEGSSEVNEELAPPPQSNSNSSSWANYDSDSLSQGDAYQNVPNLKDDLYRGDYSSDSASQRNRQQENYDPLSFEAWTKATGDGKLVPSPSDTPQTFSDYVNIESPHSEDDENSYVNVTQCNMIVPDPKAKRKNRGKPPRLKSQRNEFEKYDDDDSSIYHAVGALDEGYENVNGMGSNSRTYLNFSSKHLSPGNNTNLTYIDLGLPSNHKLSTNKCAPTKQLTPTYDKGDYTRINVGATDAMNRAMHEHRQQRDNQSTSRTPTRFSR